MLTSFFDDVFDSLMRSTDLGFGEGFPASNVITDSTGCTIELALAGYKKENLSIEVDGKYIIVAAKESEEKDSRKYHNHRIKKSAFRRVYAVPTSEYNLEELKASFEDGILTIFVPLQNQKIEQKKLIAIE